MPRKIMTDYDIVFKTFLMQFIGEQDPLLSMLECMIQKLMEIESENEV